ncbi:MAG: YdeI/OmpD-associated family protein [Bacteroidetes bacterium]|nr:YdeI/OmpD-associated family protein [Bacteroidota bacterium]
MAHIADSFGEYYAKDRKTWRKWLEKNHTKAPGIWLIYYKNGSGKTRVSWSDAVEEALCFGWIDSTSRPGDEHHYKQLFMPRKPKSGWSKINKDKVAAMIEQGMMTDAGFKVIETAKANGTWAKLDDVESDTPVPELLEAFKKNKAAKKHFDTLSKWNRKYILYWTSGAKRADTRAARIAEVIDALSQQDIPARFKRVKKS